MNCKLLLIAAILVIAAAPALAYNYQVSGNTVFVDIPGKGRISQTPAVLTGSMSFELNFTNYLATTETYDIAFGFDTDVAKPMGAVYYKPTVVNVTKSYTCDSPYWFNYTVTPKVFYCWFNTSVRNNATNVTTQMPQLVFSHSFNSADLPAKTAYWGELVNQDWQDITEAAQPIAYNYDGKDTWYAFQGVTFAPGETKTVRPSIQIRPQMKSEGKYDIFIKPSSLSIQDAIAQGRYVLLDPFWNVSYSKCVTLKLQTAADTITNKTLYLVLNDTLISGFGSRQKNSTDVVFSNSTNCNAAGTADVEVPHFSSAYNISGSTNSIFLVRTPEVSNVNTTVFNVSIYWQNNTPVVNTNNVNGTTTRFWANNGFGVDFEDGTAGTNATQWTISGSGSNQVTTVAGSLGTTGTKAGSLSDTTVDSLKIQTTGTNFAAMQNKILLMSFKFMKTGNLSGNPYWVLQDSAAHRYCEFTIQEDQSLRYDLAGAVQILPPMANNTKYEFAMFTKVTMGSDVTPSVFYVNGTKAATKADCSDDYGSLGFAANAFGWQVANGAATVVPNSLFWDDVVLTESLFPDNVTVTAGATSSGSTTPVNTTTVTLQVPANVTYAVTNISLNFTLNWTGGNLDRCKYELNGAANVTITSCLNTSFTATQGSNTLKITANNTNGSSDTKSVSFTVDSIAPVVTMTKPSNTTYGTTAVQLEYTVIDAQKVDVCTRELNGVNSTVALCANHTFTAAAGHNSVKIYANDSAGNIGVAGIEFEVDLQGPNLIVTAPQNMTYANATQPIRFSTWDSNGPITCVYSINDGANISLPGCANKTLGQATGSYKFKMYATDAFGNENVTQINYTVRYVLLNLSAIDDETGIQINSFNVSVSDGVSITLLNLTNSGNIIYGSVLDLPDGTYTIIFSANGYNPASYIVTTQNATTQNVQASMLSSASSVGVTLYAVDQYNVPFLGVAIYVSRVSGSNYIPIGTVVTDSSGFATIIIRAGATYRAVGTSSGASNVTRIFTSTTTQPIKFVFGSGVTPSYINWLRSQISGTCVKLNATRTVFCYSNDSSGAVTAYTLKVWQVFGNITSILICDKQNVTLPYATLACALPNVNVTYTWQFKAITPDATFSLHASSWSFNQNYNYGIVGVLGAFILFTIASFAFLQNRWGLIAGIIFGYVTLFVSWSIGFVRLGESGQEVIIGLGLVATIMCIVMAKVDPS